MSNATKWLFEKVEKGEQTAIKLNEQKFNYKEIYAKIIHLIKKLNESLGKDNNILLISDNSLFFVISYLSIIGSGNVCVPLRYERDMDIKKIKEELKSKHIFIQEKFKKLIKLTSFSEIYSEEILDCEEFKESFELEDFSDDKTASIMYTSGTSGKAKGVMISHINIISNTQSIIESLFLTDKDKIMVVLPFYYCFGVSLLHTHLRVGAQMVFNNNFFLPEKIVEGLIKEECTGIAGVPTTFQLLIRKSTLLEKKFPKIRCVQQAGGKLPNQDIKKLIEVFGQENVYIMYGQTEATARLSVLDPKKLDKKLGSIGRGLPGTILKVLDSSLNPIKKEEVGEIYASGKNIMKGYYNDPEETNKKIVKGMLRTGDIATIDSEGYIYVLERKENFIKSRGFRISSKKIEEAIYKLLGVSDVAVFGVDDNLLGERIIAYISPTETLKNKDVLDYCSKNLRNYEVPSEIIFAQSLPKNSSLKTDYSKLKLDYLKLKKT